LKGKPVGVGGAREQLLAHIEDWLGE